VLWKNKGRRDVLVPLPGAEAVRTIAIDGRETVLDALREGVTLTISEDPVLLLYNDGDNTLAQALGKPRAALLSPPAAVSTRDGVTLAVERDGSTATNLELKVAPFWTVKDSAPEPGKSGRSVVRFTVAPPPASSVREADVSILLKDSDGMRRGQLQFHAPMAR
jgi:hypothetical protein